MSEKCVISYSAGKDSTLSLYRAIKEGYDPIGLLTTINGHEKRSWFHGVTIDMLNKVSVSLKIPLHIIDTTKNDYDTCFSETLSLVMKEGATHCVFGDIDIEDHKNWWTLRCEKVGIIPYWPLWNENRESLVREFLELGFKAKIKVVNTDFLDDSFLGVDLSFDLIKKMKSMNVDPAGEGGEFHTFVYDGPIFNNKIDFNITDILYRDNYAMVDFTL